MFAALPPPPPPHPPPPSLPSTFTYRSKEDIKLQLRDNLLLISGERKAETTHDQEGATWTERSFGSFARSFKLPKHVDAEGISAKCDNGVLTVTVPKLEEPKPEVQEIPIA